MKKFKTTYRYAVVETPGAAAGRITYGIQAEADSGQGWQKAAAIPDISCDAAFVRQLAEKCTRGQLDPAQLLDVILDALP